MTDFSKKVISDKELKKEFEIKIPFGVLEKEVDTRAAKAQETYKLDGFRKGKVPVELIKQKHKEAFLVEAGEEMMDEITRDIIESEGYRLAMTPKIAVKEFEVGKDVLFNITLELFPKVPDVDFGKISLKKYIVEVPESDIDKTVEGMASKHKVWKEKKGKAKKGDAVKIDFLGKMDGTPFRGGEGKDHQLELGSNSFIKGFEDQLVDKKAGDECVVKVKFPKEYHAANLAGKPVEFEVKIHEVLSAEKPELTDEFVKTKFGADSLKEYRKQIRTYIEEMYEDLNKKSMREDLFEWIKKNVKLKVPEGMTEEQFNKMWKVVEEEERRNPKKFKNDKEREKLKKENKKFAEDMVRVGLVLSEWGDRNKIKVSDKEIRDEIINRARNFPNQAEAMMNYYKNNKEALEQLTGALLEQKVCDFIIDKSKVKEIKVSAKEFAKKTEKR